MRTNLCGEEWQRWANQLLTRHYGPTDYQKVPDVDRGDAGIEGFTLSKGHAYQAYGCEEPISVKTRYEKQRDKITFDINKFITNNVKLKRLFGTVPITRWVLLVPQFDSKELVEHATKKTAEVLEAKLTYTCATFQVMIADEEQFATERDLLLSAGSKLLECDPADQAQETVNNWMTENDELVATLDRKVRLLPTIRTEVARVRYRDKLLKHYLEGQEIWESLRKYPTVHEKIFQAKRRREKFLESSWMIHSGPNNELLEKALSQFVDSVQSATQVLGGFTVEALAWEAVADWMLRCPLDFPEAPSNA